MGRGLRSSGNNRRTRPLRRFVEHAEGSGVELISLTCVEAAAAEYGRKQPYSV
jgi:hypothetical protein